MSITFHSISSLAFESFVEAFNFAFADYFVPMQLSSEQMQSMIKSESIDLDRSIAALDGDRIVSFGMLAERDDVGWIGGMGTLPDYQRQGLARKVLSKLINAARERKLRYVDLEVITENQAAYSLYLDMGFKNRRLLGILSRAAQNSVKTQSTTYDVTRSEPEKVWDYFEKFHDVENPWQRSQHAISLSLPSLGAYAVSDDKDSGDILGFAVGMFHEKQIHFVDMAIHPDHEDRAGIAQALLARIHHDLPEANAIMVNVGEDEAIYTPMKDFGYQQVLAQYEMRLQL